MKDGIFIDMVRFIVGLYGSNILILYLEGMFIVELVECVESVEYRGVEVGSYIENVMKC